MGLLPMAISWLLHYQADLRALKKVGEWTSGRGFGVNAGKTEVVIFTRRYRPQPIRPLDEWDGTSTQR